MNWSGLNPLLMLSAVKSIIFSHKKAEGPNFSFFSCLRSSAESGATKNL